ncbi:hypothetical protein J2S78_002846 [Salibacterium salarium]|nr:hypothetical protein [Salibacterium salarium]
MAVLITILGAIGFKEKNKPARFRSWFTVILSSSLTILLFILLSFSTFFSVEKEFIKEIHSPDKNYKIDFYQTDAGAAGSFGIIGELNGPLWFKKRIYFQDDTKTVEIEWENNHIIIINDDRLNLKTT